MKWQHVYPLGDLIEHELEGFDCPCGPGIDFDNQIVTHVAMDCRELCRLETTTEGSV
jgi:hypothetical protein